MIKKIYPWHSRSWKRKRVNKLTYIPDAKVLVVDDDKVNLKVTQSVFSQFSIRIDMAESGKEALEMVQNQRYDMIFMDQMMPEMSGKETVAQIRKNPLDYFKKLPIYMLSAQEEGLAKEIEGLGVLGVLFKPVKAEDLDKALESLPLDLIFSSKEEKRIPPQKNLTAFVEEGENVLHTLKQAAQSGAVDGFVHALSGIKKTAIAAGANTFVKMIREYEFKRLLEKKEEILRNMPMVLKFLENYLESVKKTVEK